MTDFDDTMATSLRAEQARREAGRTPPFDAVFAEAETLAVGRVRRRRATFGVAALAAVTAIAAGVLLPRDSEWQYVNPEDFATGTTWVAPSDILLPEHSIDIYRDIPVLIESTDGNGGALL